MALETCSSMTFFPGRIFSMTSSLLGSNLFAGGILSSGSLDAQARRGVVVGGLKVSPNSSLNSPTLATG